MPNYGPELQVELDWHASQREKQCSKDSKGSKGKGSESKSKDIRPMCRWSGKGSKGSSKSKGVVVSKSAAVVSNEDGVYLKGSNGSTGSSKSKGVEGSKSSDDNNVVDVDVLYEGWGELLWLD